MQEKYTSSFFKSALGGQCPRCGKGALYEYFLQLGKECPHCRLNYAFIDTGDGPAVFAIFILGFAVLGGALWVEFTYGPPLWVHLVLWGVGTPVVAFLLLRFLKGLLIYLQYRNDAAEGKRVDI